MSKRKKRTFTKDFKEKAVELALNSEQKLTEVAKSLEISHSTLASWKKAYRLEKGLASKSELNSIDQVRENIELKKKIKQLEMENDILKKAATFFAKEQY